MLKGFGKVVGARNGIMHFAEVTLTVDPRPSTPFVRVSCTGNGFVAQGYSEFVTLEGYDDWKLGAIRGAEHAARVADRSEVGITIRVIEGLLTDTNPSVAGAASALAVWNALGFEPSPEALAHVNAIAAVGWELGAEAVPEF